MLNSFLCKQRDWEKDKCHFLVLVLKRSGTVSVKTVHESVGQYGWKDLVGIRRGRLKKQRPWKIVDTLCNRFGNDRDYFSHKCLCKSAQSLRSNRRDMWRVWNLSRWNGATHCERTIEFLIRAKRDQDRNAFGLWWPCSKRSSIATVWRTNWKVITTRQIEQIWYGWQDFWLLLKSDNTSWPKTLQNSQFTNAVACREYIFPRDEGASGPKGRTRGNSKIGPVLEVTTCCLHGKYGVEIRINSVNRDNSHSCVRISHDCNKLVTNWTAVIRKPQKLN